MFTLAIETSTQTGSVAIGKDGKLLTQKFSAQAKSHSDELHKLIAEATNESGIRLNQVDLFAVGQGPGSFTGVRVAINAVRAFAYSLKKPTFVLDSLALMSLQTTEPAICMLNAFKGLIYFSYYHNGVAIIPPKTISPVQMDEELKKIGKSQTITIGDAYSVYESQFSENARSQFVRNNQLNDYPSAEYLVSASSDSKFQTQTKAWNSTLPLYLRASSAEENLNK